MLYKSKQICAYADDIVLIARSMPALQEMSTIESAGKSPGLQINEDKTKYMKMEVDQADNTLTQTIQTRGNILCRNMGTK